MEGKAKHCMRTHNPLYLLSASSMLLGCYILNGMTDLHPQSIQRVVSVLIVLNVYEALLILLGSVLAKRRTLPSAMLDSRLLFILAVVFLCDLTSFVMPCLEADLAWGVLANTVLLGLSILKLTFIIRLLGLPYRGREKSWTILELVALFGVPCVLAYAKNRTDLLPAWTMAAWWTFGAILLGKSFLFSSPGVERASPRASSLVTSGVRRAIWVVPSIAILAHIISMNWVYHVPLHLSSAAPLFLAASVWTLRSRSSRLAKALAMPAGAVLVSLSFPKEFANPAMGLSPLRLALVGAAAVYAYAFYLRRDKRLIPLALFCAVNAVLGYSVETIRHTAGAVTGRVLHLMPETETEWGRFAVAFAFVLLGIGALRSLQIRKGPDVAERDA